MTSAKISTFNPNYEGFNSKKARQLAGLVQKSYDQFDDSVKQTNKFANWTQSCGYEIFPLLEQGINPFGFIAYDEQNSEIFVVFRGTKKFMEWFKDADTRLVPYPVNEDNIFGSVTAGFRGIYVNLKTQIQDALKKLTHNSNTQVFVTGHSLGGALATLAIPDILKNSQFTDSKRITLYTFASPRCGNREFATKFEGTKVQHWRIANTEDIVTTVPFPTGNIFEIKDQEIDKEKPNPEIEKEKPSEGGGMKGGDKNPNPIFGFFNDMFERIGETFDGNKRRMPDYVHTGTPIYFTIHEAALERHHNLDEVYMLGISEDPLTISNQE